MPLSYSCKIFGVQLMRGRENFINLVVDCLRLSAEQLLEGRIKERLLPKGILPCATTPGFLEMRLAREARCRAGCASR